MIEIRRYTVTDGWGNVISEGINRVDNNAVSTD